LSSRTESVMECVRSLPAEAAAQASAISRFFPNYSTRDRGHAQTLRTRSPR